MIEHDQSCKLFVVSKLFHKTGGGGRLLEGRRLFKILADEGALIRTGDYLRGGANSRIYGEYIICTVYTEVMG